MAEPLYRGERTLSSAAGQRPAASGLTIADAVQYALRHNPGLGAEAAQAHASESGRKSARGAFGPKLGTSYSVVKQERETSPRTNIKPAEKGVYAWGVEVSQPIFQGFRLLAAYQKAALQADSDKAAVRKAELDVVLEVQTQFLNYLRHDEDMRSKREARQRLQEQLDITRAFHEVGLRPRLDVLQAEVNMRQAEEDLILAENNRATALAGLNTLLGLSAADDTVKYVGSLGYVKFRRSLEQCLEAAWRLRADIYIAAKAIEIAGKSQMEVQSAYYPQVEGYYNVTSTGNTPDLKASGNYGSSSTTWEVGARLTWDVFQWGTTHYADQQAGWLVTKVRHEAEKLKLAVGYDVKSRFLALREAEKRIHVAEKGVEQGMEAYEAALARYREQVGTNFEVLDASSKLTAVQASLAAARADYLTALAGMYVTMGEFHPNLMQP